MRRIHVVHTLHKMLVSPFALFPFALPHVDPIDCASQQLLQTHQAQTSHCSCSRSTTYSPPTPPAMAPKATLAMLFHPKKGAKKETPARSPSPRKATSAPPRPKSEIEEEEELKLPDGPYQEFKLMSSALNGWKYDVMKFDSRKPIDISRWTPPIKLNRKELRRDDEAGDGMPEAVGPMLGPDGKPVIGVDGKMVMVDAEGRPIHNMDGSSGSRDAKGKGSGANAKKRFQKKTRQVFFVPEEVRQLRREERYPWVMEDSSPAQNEVWIGQMEDAAKSETHAFFMPAANDVFKFVPAHRWYKFQKKLKHGLPTDTAHVESLYTKHQKQDPQAWLASRTGKGPSAATAAMFKAEAEGRTVSVGNSLVHTSGQSLAPGGRKLRTVDSGMSGLFDDDEDADVKRRREKEFGGEGDMDEQVFEEDFADDEEKMDVDDNNDDEAKELEERLKREYKTANKLRDTGVDESDEEELPGMSKQAKAMQKLIRNREGNEAYESEEEENPYASSVEEEEEEPPVVPTEPAIQPQPQQVESRAGTPAPKPGGPVLTQPGTGSRATSPTVSPPLGGHSIVAKRATSPKAPKLKSNNISRGNSPLGSTHAVTAGVPATGSRAGSPVNNKRKAVDDVANGAPLSNAPNGTANVVPPKPKKRKAGPGAPPISVPADQLRVMLIDWLGNTPNATTRECIHHFTPYLTDGDKKTEFSALVREVAQLKGGVLVLRKKYHEGGSSAPSPAPASS
ncbi:Transcription initiation factor IIF subunit alpha [Hypsizygus marmoreus]|uniref:Transcription initiation factor IIF subunit alpha n=1 Tax=Hypsizygus marmoreus TaxID=39966 RepID=A0A369JQ56_HYPMA|nr:Transcription initiation factor IIF subunit alpha [Hypsizygus marmoreus]